MNNHILQHFIAANFPAYAMHLVAINEIEQITEQVQYRKNEILFAQGKIVHQLIFIENGNLMAYDAIKGIKKVHRFWFNQQPIFLLNCLLNQQPILHTIVAINDCSLHIINYNKLIKLAQNHPSIWEIIILLNNYENQLLQKQIDLLTLDPKARYKLAMEQHPELIQLITADLLASYLNMGYSTFARFRQSRD